MENKVLELIDSVICKDDLRAGDVIMLIAMLNSHYAYAEDEKAHREALNYIVSSYLQEADWGLK